MDNFKRQSELNKQDEVFVDALKRCDDLRNREFFYHEIGGILHRIRIEVFRGLVDFDEMVSELYLYLSKDNWAKLDSFDARGGSRLRTWMIPVAWRFFISIREKLLFGKEKPDLIRSDSSAEQLFSEDDLRIQIAIDVNAVLGKMPNRRYAEIIRLLIVEGYAPKDVAEMLGMKTDNVYNLKHRAIAQFIDLYGQR
ncbi:MAG: sigma-70 family RNA polymerase sigma factor [Muribaculaceae bacterium]|nr:sigma-70 family RNA polymerase sigma factor [Muribaculaceae bacterium]